MKHQRMLFILWLMLLCLLPRWSTSQNLYISFDAGYGMKMSPQNNDWYYTNIDYVYSVYTSEKVGFSLGQGIKTGFTFGYKLSDHISFEAGAGFFSGSPCRAHYIRIDSVAPYTNMNYQFSAEMFRLSPSFVVSTGDGKLRPYTKFGCTFGRGSLTEIHDGISSGESLYIEYRYNKGISFGLTAAIGATVDFSDKWSFFGEINTTNMSYAPQKRTTMAYSKNGVDQLPNMTASEVDVEYVDSDVYDFNNQPLPTEPSRWLKEHYSLNSVNVSLGIRMHF